MRKPAVLPVLAMTVIACEPASETAPVPRYPTGAGLVAMMSAGEITSVAIVHELIGRSVREEGLNALINVDADRALALAKELDDLRAAGNLKGPLHGIPLVVKDNIHVAGLPNTAGTPGLASFIPEDDSPVISALRDAGAIILAKANMHELAFGITSDNAGFGAVANPVDTRMIAGGSSGGTASAIAAGIAPAGLGTDTGGSVRIPAALTGLVGYRPSTGRYPGSGITPISHTRDTIGLMARTVADIVLLDRAIVATETEAAPEPGEIRLGVPREYYFTNLDRQTAAVVDNALMRLSEAGVVLVEADPPGIAALVAQSGFPIALYEAEHDLSAYLTDNATGLSLTELAAGVASPDVRGIFAGLTGDGRISADTYASALELRGQLREVFDEFFATHDLDAIVFPTTILPARQIEGSMQTVELNGEQVPTFPTYIRNTDPGSIAALPGISLPAGLTTDGLPVGIEIDGPEGSDERLLAVAAAVESLIGSSARPPVRQ